MHLEATGCSCRSGGCNGSLLILLDGGFSVTVHNLSLCVVIFESRDNNGMGLALASTRTCRLRLAARTLRLGYNVMFLDTDVIIFDDPYKCVQ